jgi:LmbE family N-acetylglucosaminyl deacetylase
MMPHGSPFARRVSMLAVEELWARREAPAAGRCGNGRRYTRPSMAHVFVAPHPDDVALSCGGLIASLRELGQNVTILTVFSGSGSNGAGSGALTSYQREALGFGTKTLWPATEAFNRASIRADWPGTEADTEWLADEDRLEATQEDADASAKRFWQRASWYRRASIRNRPLAGQALMDDVATQGALYTDDVVAAATAGEIVARRRVEDERFAYFAEASVVFLDLPDAVFRGYASDAELLGTPREDDDDVFDAIRREVNRLEPQKVYFPLGVGGHVDHQLCRDAGVRLLSESRRWVMPGPEYAGIVTFYEDFPYAWWQDFSRLEDLPPDAFAALPADITLAPSYADISDQLERKIQGITTYESQMDRLFGGTREMARQARAHAKKVALLGGISSAAERYWSTRQV